MSDEREYNIYIEWHNYAIRCTGEATLEEMDSKIAEAYTALKNGFNSETDGRIEMLGSITPEQTLKEHND